MHQMQNEISILRRGANMNSRNPPQGVGSLNLGFINRTEGNQRNETSTTRNRAPCPHIPNAMIWTSQLKIKQS